jgi:tRNA(Ile)-lysidine synthase
VRVEQGADAIITAHHQDDMVETAVINMIRGTGSRGLSALKSAGDIVRPLLGITKGELLAYAAEHNLQWREDSTNQDERYLRNYIRLQLLPKLTPAGREALLHAVMSAADLNQQIDGLLSPHIKSEHMDRYWFIQLPHAVAREAMAAWLRQFNATFDRKAIERLVVFGKTAQSGKLASVDGRHSLQASKEHIILR